MHKLKDFLLLAVLPSIVIVLAYAGYDYWSCMQKRLETRPVLSASVFQMPVVGPVIPHDKLPRRKYVEINGKQINEKDFTRVLVLDLNGDGISICGLKNIKKCAQWPKYNSFDFNQDGFREQTPYLGTDDVLLLYPAQKDTKDSKIAGDIIGTYFQGNRDKSLGAFDILRSLAGEKEVLRKDDDVFTNLYITRYEDRLNGAARKDLSDAGVDEISLNIVPNREILPSGNMLGDYTEVTLADGSKRKLQEVWLYNNYMVVNRTQLTENEKTKGIPDISGMGTILPLWDAVTQDESGKLENLVRKYMREPNFFVREAMLPEIIYQWAGVADVDPLSRISEDGINHIGDARKVAAVEKFLGDPFIGTHSWEEETPNPHYQSTPYVWKGFENMVAVLRLRLDTAGVLKPILMSVKYSKSNGEETLKNAIRKFENKYGTLQTKLLMSSKCEVFSMDGKISPQLNLADCDEFVIRGTVEDDILNGKKNKDNIFIGSYRNDLLNGGKADDVYIYGLHDGGDIIVEKGGYDKIMLLGDITPEMVSFDKHLSDLVIKVGTNGGVILISDFGKSEDNQVEELVFADGKTVSLPEIYVQLPDKKKNDAKDDSGETPANDIQLRRLIDADARTMNAVINDGKWYSSAELHKMMKDGLLTEKQLQSVNSFALKKFNESGRIIDKQLSNFYQRKAKRKSKKAVGRK